MEREVAVQHYSDLVAQGHKPVPCTNPEKVDGWVSLKELMEGVAGDFGKWTESNMNYKRDHKSYDLLKEHLQKGGGLNHPVFYCPPDEYNHQGYLSNGHHRVCAAVDAGFTHIPYNSEEWGDDYDWTGTENAESGMYYGHS